MMRPNNTLNHPVHRLVHLHYGGQSSEATNLCFGAAAQNNHNPRGCHVYWQATPATIVIEFEFHATIDADAAAALHDAMQTDKRLTLCRKLFHA